MKPKVIDIKTFEDNLDETLGTATGKQVVIVKIKGEEKLAIVDIDYLEDLLAANNPKYLAGIAEARKQYKNGETFTHEEVFSDLLDGKK